MSQKHRHFTGRAGGATGKVVIRRGSFFSESGDYQTGRKIEIPKSTGGVPFKLPKQVAAKSLAPGLDALEVELRRLQKNPIPSMAQREAFLKGKIKSVLEKELERANQGRMRASWERTKAIDAKKIAIQQRISELK